MRWWGELTHSLTANNILFATCRCCQMSAIIDLPSSPTMWPMTWYDNPPHRGSEYLFKKRKNQREKAMVPIRSNKKAPCLFCANKILSIYNTHLHRGALKSYKWACCGSPIVGWSKWWKSRSSWALMRVNVTMYYRFAGCELPPSGIPLC